ncbi:hypothetical protein PS15p_203236 [Mucor circinelloides]
MSFLMDDHDEFEDDWDEFTPSAQDTLYEKLESIENNAAATKLESGKEIEDIDGDFNVFLDELFEIPFKFKEKAKKQTPLGEICVNKQHKSTFGPAQSKENTTDECSLVYDSQDDSMWSNVDLDILSNMETDSKYAINNPKDIETTDISLRSSSMPPPLPLKSESASNTMKGFTTASGKALKPVSDEAKKIALSLFNDDQEWNKEGKPAAMSGFSTASGKSLKPVSEKAQKAAFALFEKADDEMKNKPKNASDGIKTASGKSLHKPSKTSIQAASKLFGNEKELNGRQERQGLKRPNDHLIDPELKYESVLDKYGGFHTGSSKKKINISSRAKKEALSLFEKDSTVPDSPKSASIVPEITTSPKQVVQNTLVNVSNDAKQSIPNQLGRNKRFKTSQKQNKPFKSPIIRSNIELTKAAISNKGSTKLKGQPVFDLTPPKYRYKLSSLGKPISYSKEQLISKNIPQEIIDMSVEKAASYKFQSAWGWKEAQRDMIDSNCVPSRLTAAWVQNHYSLIVWKIACQIRSYPDQFIDQWQTKSVLNQLLYRYEREVNLGQRPVLRKILEQDDNSVKHMVLVIADIIKTENSSFYNTSTKYRLVLSDGWYKIHSCIDLRMEHAITRKKLKIGHKLSICGAQIIGDKTAQSPLSIKESDTLLSITSNGCLPARWDEKLGYHRRKLMIRSLPTIFDDGGTVTAIDIIVCRKLPILYSESLANGATITRTAKEEEDVLRRIENRDAFNGVQRQQSYAIPNFRASHKSSNAPHLDRTVSEPKSLEERRVSGFFKVRVCDATARGADQPWATLLLSNANELNHMDIVEGNRFRVFFVQPYHPKNKKYGGLDIKTTRMTRWEPAPLNTVTKTAYIPRFLTLCADIRYQDRLSDFDLVVYVLRKSMSSSTDQL